MSTGDMKEHFLANLRFRCRLLRLRDALASTARGGALDVFHVMLIRLQI